MLTISTNLTSNLMSGVLCHYSLEVPPHPDTPTRQSSTATPSMLSEVESRLHYRLSFTSLLHFTSFPGYDGSYRNDFHEYDFIQVSLDLICPPTHTHTPDHTTHANLSHQEVNLYSMSVCLFMSGVLDSRHSYWQSPQSTVLLLFLYTCVPIPISTYGNN